VTAGTLGLILSASIVSGNAWWHSNEVSLRENRRGPIKVSNDLPDDLGGWLAGSEHDLAYAQPISKESD
jgi:hypothetical protein